MANERVYNSTDAAGIKPKLIPNYELMPRDDSGGPDWDGRTAEFGDGGFVVGQEEKHHISATSGGQHARKGTELDEQPRVAGYEKAAGKQSKQQGGSKVDDKEAEA